MPIAPEGFARSLSLMDRALSIRWGAVLRKWVIEREAYIEHSEVSFLRRRYLRTERIARAERAAQKPSWKKHQNTADQIHEEFLSALTGRRVIIFTDVLDRRVFDALALADVQRYGGFSRWMSEVEEREAIKERDVERQLKNERETVHKEMYDQLNYVWTKRETQLLDGKRSLTELLK